MPTQRQGLFLATAKRHVMYKELLKRRNMELPQYQCVSCVSTIETLMHLLIPIPICPGLLVSSADFVTPNNRHFWNPAKHQKSIATSFLHGNNNSDMLECLDIQERSNFQGNPTISKPTQSNFRQGIWPFFLRAKQKYLLWIQLCLRTLCNLFYFLSLFFCLMSFICMLFYFCTL